MATHRMSIMGSNTVPDTSGNVFFEPYNVRATNDVWKYLIVVYLDTTTRDGLHVQFPVPKNYVGTPKIIVVWTAAVTTGDVEWDFDYRAVGGNDLESLDQTGTQESLNVADTAPSAIHERMEASFTLTAANLAVDDTVQCTLFRDGTDAGDTMSSAALLHDVLFEWADA